MIKFKQRQRSMKQYTKPEVRTVVLPDSLMGDVNIGFGSKPYKGDGKLPTGAKENTLDEQGGSTSNPNSSLWDE